MGGRHADEPSLTGTVHTVPFKGLAQEEAIRQRLSALATRVEGTQIDVVTRFPGGVDQVEAALDGDPTADSQSLSVDTLSGHALATATAGTDRKRWVSAAGENALLVDHATEYEWNTGYLADASEHDTFYRDLRSFVADAMRYPDLDSAEDPVIDDLLEFTDSFYTLLDDADYIPREAVVRVAVEQFRECDSHDVTLPDAVFAVQFDEFTAVERLYLAYLTRDAEFVGLARENASIFRTQFEPGRIGERTDLDVEPTTNTVAPRAPEAVAEWLAEGGELSLSGDGAVRWLEAETYEEHVRTIGTAIQHLQSRDVALNDIAVVFRDASAPIGEAVDILWSMGLPVSSTVAGGLEHDTAIRELYTVIEYLVEREAGSPTTELASHRERLAVYLEGTDLFTDVDDVVARALEATEAAGRVGSLENGLAQWLTETQLKHRVANEGDTLHQRLTFDHVTQVLELAQFIDESDLVTDTWERFQRALEFEADYSASQQVTAELESREVGVTVDTVGSLRGKDFRFVFVAAAVDDEYPAGPMLNRLVPITRSPDIDLYPRALPDGLDAVRRTFATPEPPTEHPVRAYTQSLNRRILAEACRMADEGLYFVTYGEAPQRTGKQVHPSRYLSAIDAEVDGVKTTSGATEVQVPEQVALDTVDERYRQALLEPESLPDEETLAREFGAVRTVVEASDEALREALASRRDWARGVIGDE